MEYLGRLGLVARKNKKKRGTVSPFQGADSKETRRSALEPGGDGSYRNSRASRAFDTDLKSANDSILLTAPETGYTQLACSAVLDMPMSSDRKTTDLYFPRLTSTFEQDAVLDFEYLEYEQHVQARARSLTSGDNFAIAGGRHAWKTLMFWKRQKRPTGMTSLSVSAASTPIHHQAFPTPSATPSRTSHVNPRMRGSSTRPLYMIGEFPTSNSMQHFSQRPWCEPMLREGKVTMPRKDEYCNMSPYVPLAGRKPRAASGPLYFV